MVDRGFTIQLTPESQRVLAKLEKNTKRQQIFFDRAIAIFDRAGLLLAGKISSGPLASGVTTKDSLRQRSGSLARSIVGFGTMVNGAPAMRVGVLRGPASPYAGILHEGTRGAARGSRYPDIVPRRGKALSIPVGESLTATGVARYDSPRKHPGLAFIPLRRKASSTVLGLLVDREQYRGLRSRKQDTRPATRYILVSRVRMPSRPFIRQVFEPYLPKLGTDIDTLLKEFARGR